MPAKALRDQVLDRIDLHPHQTGIATLPHDLEHVTATGRARLEVQVEFAWKTVEFGMDAERACEPSHSQHARGGFRRKSTGNRIDEGHGSGREGGDRVRIGACTASLGMPSLHCYVWSCD
jgi:hypothetical protein